MNAKQYFQKYGRERCEAVALAAGTKPGYFMQIVYGHRNPSRKLAKRLVEASDNKMKFAALLDPQ